MIVDTSAILAVFLKEPGHEAILEVLTGADVLGIGSPTLAETGIVLESRFGEPGAGWLRQFVEEFGLTVIPFGEMHAREATAAYACFGKGRHEAGLNLGDCLTYAVARLAGQPLLCIGADFPRTDLDLVQLGLR
jgi:Uncharacterized protein conserved in bacteria